MKISVVSFTRAGAARNLELVRILQENNHQAVSYSWHKYTGRKLIPFKSLKLLMQDLWDSQDVFLFLWDLEHVARAVSSYLKRTGEGPAVVVMDEAGQFVLPFTAGNMQGTDAWCSWLAQLVDATPVITKASFLEESFDADVFARKNQLHIQDIFRIRSVVLALSSGEAVGIYSDYPIDGVLPEGLVRIGTVMNGGEQEEGTIPEVGISITDDWEAPRFAKECRMFPRNLVLGVICTEQTGAAELEQFVVGALAEKHLSKDRVCGLFSTRELAEAAGLRKLADRLDVPFFTYEKEQISQFETDGKEICEACAKLGSMNGKALVACCKRDEMLVSVYEKEVKLSF